MSLTIAEGAERADLVEAFIHSPLYQQHLLPWLMEERELARDAFEAPPSAEGLANPLLFAVRHAELRGRIEFLAIFLGTLAAWRVGPETTTPSAS